MIHNHECDRCTHQWCSSCMEEMMVKPKEKKRWLKHLWSGLCWDCFEQLEAGEIKGLEVYELYTYLHEKHDRLEENSEYRFSVNKGTKENRWFHHWGYRCQTTEDTPVDDTPWKLPLHKYGRTFEQEVLSGVMQGVKELYEDIIKQQRTPKRIELDEFQKTARYVFFGEQPRPEGFVGDPPGKQRFEVLFGLDLASGSIIPPTIVANDGTKQCDIKQDGQTDLETGTL